MLCLRSYLFTLFVITFAGCGLKKEPEPPLFAQTERHYEDPLSNRCSYALFHPRHPSPKSRLLIVQYGSNVFSFDQGYTPAIIELIGRKIADEDYVLEVDQPGVASSNSPYRDRAPGWSTRQIGEVEVYRTRQNFVWGASDYARCYLTRIEQISKQHKINSIDVYGNSLGGDILVRLLELSRKKSPRTFQSIKRIFLSAPFLENSKELFFRQVAILNEENKRQTQTVTEQLTDPATGQIISKTYTEPVLAIDPESAWQTILQLKSKDLPEARYLPNEKVVHKIRLPGWDFSNLYLQSVYREGPAMELLKKLIEKTGSSKQFFLYQGRNDWRVNPAIVEDLSAQVHSPALNVHFYNADHDLFSDKKFLKDFAKDFTLPGQHN